MNITPELFEAFLKCATKCWLRAVAEPPSGNAYAEWVKTQSESYQTAESGRLLGDSTIDEVAVSPASDNLKAAKWRLATNVTLRAGTDSCPLESTIHAIERAPAEGRGRAAQFIPIRFIFTNKLDKDDRLLLAFDAFVLSAVLRREVTAGKIIHGDNQATLKVKTSPLAGEVRKRVEKIDTLLSGPTPPDLVLNRHCAECEFQARCRKIAIEKDDLSLLSRMSAKERLKLRSKGIFTVTQLSYTFRPRRRPKRLRDKREKYHHSLKALAIREKKIHIVGSPELKIEGTPVYLDVEGLPDRDFYYLIGLRIGSGDSALQHSLWADTVADEGKIWREFLVILEIVEQPVLIHYGSYETTFLKRMSERYGGSAEGSVSAKAVEGAINVVSVLFAKIYLPTLTNGLKDVAKKLGFQWSDPTASGTRSVEERHAWEQSRDPTAKEWLVTYNDEDCKALDLVAASLLRICGTAERLEASKSNNKDLVDVESLKPQMPFSFGKRESVTPDVEFLRKAAYWDYQRDRLNFRSQGKRKTKSRKIPDSCNTTSMRINKVVVHEISPECPTCKRISTKPKATRVRILYDLQFGQFSIKRWIVKHIYQTFFCWRCDLIFGLEKSFRKPLKFGWNLLSYFVYQTVELCIPQRIATLSMSRLFGYCLKCTTTHKFKTKAAGFYKETQCKILARLSKGDLVHADETRANVKGKLAYVWVFTNLREVAYLYADSREADVLHATLAGFRGVLVSDFYAAYDSLECPQQKCLIHLLRDLNSDVLGHPYDDELKELIKRFGSLVRPMVETADRRGLKRHFLRKHRKHVDRFFRELGKASYHSEAALKCKDRFEKNREKLFTFLNYDGIPWNNNNAEHAIKAFAALRDVMQGTSTQAGLEEYLTLLSVCQTCKYMGVDFLDFLRSGEKDIHAFAETRGRRKLPSQPLQPTSSQSDAVADGAASHDAHTGE